MNVKDDILSPSSMKSARGSLTVLLPSVFSITVPIDWFTLSVVLTVSMGLICSVGASVSGSVEASAPASVASAADAASVAGIFSSALSGAEELSLSPQPTKDEASIREAVNAKIFLIFIFIPLRFLNF